MIPVVVPLGMSAHALSHAIRVPATRVNDIVNGKRGVTADTTLRLARYFGNSPEFRLNPQAAYDLRAVERHAAARIKQEISPRQAAVRAAIHEWNDVQPADARVLQHPVG